jgi:hypothetical protein
MADIGYECAVYPGGQSVIDAGVATVITANESPFALASSPGDAGTLWITGHRESHGGPFAAVPDLADGAIITVSDGSAVASYVVVGRVYVEVRDGLAVDASGTPTEAATMDAVLRPDHRSSAAERTDRRVGVDDNLTRGVTVDHRRRLDRRPTVLVVSVSGGCGTGRTHGSPISSGAYSPSGSSARRTR